MLQIGHETSGSDRRLREREEVRAEADLAFFPEERPHDVEQRSLQVGEREVTVDGEPLELVDIGKCVASIASRR